MKFDPEKHHRRSIRFKVYDYSSPGYYFVTICVQNRECVLGEIVNGIIRLNQWGKIVRDEWFKTAKIRKNVELDEFVVMPNHFHGIIMIMESVGATRWVAPTNPSKTAETKNWSTRRVAPTEMPARLQCNSLGAVIGQFKSVVTKKIRKMGLANFKWQRNYYDHIIRNDRELWGIRQYIRHNPFKWELDNENPKNWK